MMGPAAAYAQDTRAALAREPVDAQLGLDELEALAAGELRNVDRPQ